MRKGRTLHAVVRASVFVTALGLLAGAPLGAQMDHGHEGHDQMPETGVRAEVLRDLADVEEKMVGLAEAIPQGSYAWRPMEGVRSASEVFMHVAIANYMLPSVIGTPVPEGAGFTSETMDEFEGTADKESVVAALRGSFEHLRQVVANTPDSDLDNEVMIFGQPGTVRSFFFLACTHAHEHLGQMIAYARANRIRPPWSGMSP